MNTDQNLQIFSEAFHPSPSVPCSKGILGPLLHAITLSAHPWSYGCGRKRGGAPPAAFGAGRGRARRQTRPQPTRPRVRPAHGATGLVAPVLS
jgi:hypothetical protein